MTNEEVMQTLTDMGLHEGGMDNWVADNAWVTFAALVVSAEREACAKVCDELPAPDIYSHTDKSMWDVTCMDCAAAIRSRSKT